MASSLRKAATALEKAEERMTTPSWCWREEENRSRTLLPKMLPNNTGQAGIRTDLALTRLKL